MRKFILLMASLLLLSYSVYAKPLTSVADQDSSYTYVQPIDGGMVIMLSPQTVPFESVIIDPAGPLTNLTIVLPACDLGSDGFFALFTEMQQLGVVTLTAAGGSSVVVPFGVNPGGGSQEYLCRAADATWYFMH